MWILWRVRLKLRQKVGLGVFFSLSTCMAVVSAIRLGGERYHGNYDFSWRFFWIEVEVCTAVSVVSLTAFPAVFVSRKSSRPRGGHNQSGKPWYPSTIGKPRNRDKIRFTDDLTGMSQYMSKWPTYPLPIASNTGRGGRTDTTLRSDGEEEIPPGQTAQPQGQQDVPLERLTRRDHGTDTTSHEQV